ncbi:MAG: fused MFS/spermidine synthase [Coriobacteriia bacterium]|nr:fused MFS/spermidine synthase [Coriobacteriia bacterium]
MPKNTSTDEPSVVAKVPRFLIEIVVFLCGAVVMVLELVGSRLLAPYFGNSLFVWTALIGVMLGFIAIGGYLGGRLGDKRHSTEALFWILIAASLSVSLIAIAEQFIMPMLSKGMPLRMGAIAAAIALFGAPSVLLGMISPYCIRLKMHAVADSGATVGTLYALSTLGSIGGTFLAGFWLIAVLGSHNIVLLLAGVLLALSLTVVMPITSRKGIGVAVALVVLIATAMFSKPSIDAFDTQYDRYFISHETDEETGRPVVLLSRGFDSNESGAFADNGEPVIFQYYRYYDLAVRLVPDVKKTLVIGGGTFEWPRHQLTDFPDSTTDVVEIDPALVDVAKESFFLKDDPRMEIVVADGRTFLNESSEKYDVILIDAFKSANSIPYQLTTYESMKRVRDSLDEDGVLAINVVASLNGPGSRFVWSEYETLKKLFPQVEVYAVQVPEATGVVQNISMIASVETTNSLQDRAMQIAPELAGKRIEPSATPASEFAKVITDDHAPVDQYLMGVRVY